MGFTGAGAGMFGDTLGGASCNEFQAAVRALGLRVVLLAGREVSPWPGLAPF